MAKGQYRVLVDAGNAPDVVYDKVTRRLLVTKTHGAVMTTHTTTNDALQDIKVVPTDTSDALLVVTRVPSRRAGDVSHDADSVSQTRDALMGSYIAQIELLLRSVRYADGADERADVESRMRMPIPQPPDETPLVTLIEDAIASAGDAQRAMFKALTERPYDILVRLYAAPTAHTQNGAFQCYTLRLPSLGHMRVRSTAVGHVGVYLLPKLAYQATKGEYAMDDYDILRKVVVTYRMLTARGARTVRHAIPQIGDIAHHKGVMQALIQSGWDQGQGTARGDALTLRSLLTAAVNADLGLDGPDGNKQQGQQPGQPSTKKNKGKKRKRTTYPTAAGVNYAAAFTPRIRVQSHADAINDGSNTVELHYTKYTEEYSAGLRVGHVLVAMDGVALAQNSKGANVYNLWRLGKAFEQNGQNNSKAQANVMSLTFDPALTVKGSSASAFAESADSLRRCLNFAYLHVREAKNGEWTPPGCLPTLSANELCDLNKALFPLRMVNVGTAGAGVRSYKQAYKSCMRMAVHNDAILREQLLPPPNLLQQYKNSLPRDAQMFTFSALPGLLNTALAAPLTDVTYANAVLLALVHDVCDSPKYSFASTSFIRRQSQVRKVSDSEYEIDSSLGAVENDLYVVLLRSVLLAVRETTAETHGQMQIRVVSRSHTFRAAQHPRLLSDLQVLDFSDLVDGDGTRAPRVPKVDTLCARHPRLSVLLREMIDGKYQPLDAQTYGLVTIAFGNRQLKEPDAQDRSLLTTSPPTGADKHASARAIAARYRNGDCFAFSLHKNKIRWTQAMYGDVVNVLVSDTDSDVQDDGEDASWHSGRNLKAVLLRNGLHVVEKENEVSNSEPQLRLLYRRHYRADAPVGKGKAVQAQQGQVRAYERMQTVNVNDGTLVDVVLEVVPADPARVYDALQQLYSTTLRPTEGRNEMGAVGMGINKFESLLRSKFWGISRQDATEFLSNKEERQVCLRPPPVPRTFRHFQETRQMNEMWQMDSAFISPTLQWWPTFKKVKGQKKVCYGYVAAIDVFTRYAWVQPLLGSRANKFDANKDGTTQKDARDCLHNAVAWCKRRVRELRPAGVPAGNPLLAGDTWQPRTVQTDNGSEFGVHAARSKIGGIFIDKWDLRQWGQGLRRDALSDFQRDLAALGIRFHATSLPHTPQQQAYVETFNKTFKTKLRDVVMSDKQYSMRRLSGNLKLQVKVLAIACHNYNNSVHASMPQTKQHLTPAKLAALCMTSGPVDPRAQGILKSVRDFRKNTYDRYMDNRARGTRRLPELDAGDIVRVALMAGVSRIEYDATQEEQEAQNMHRTKYAAHKRGMQKYMDIHYSTLLYVIYDKSNAQAYGEPQYKVRPIERADYERHNAEYVADDEPIQYEHVFSRHLGLYREHLQQIDLRRLERMNRRMLDAPGAPVPRITRQSRRNARRTRRAAAV